MNMNEIASAWYMHCDRAKFGTLGANAGLTLLTNLYRDRAYHNLGHVMSMLKQLHEFRTTGVIKCADLDLCAMETAIWFHDAIYDPRAAPGQNELASAAIARLFEHGAARAFTTNDETNYTARVRACIVATDPFLTNPPLLVEAALVADLDLSGLAVQYPVFDAQSDNIRREFAHLTDREWLEGRQKFFRMMLDRPRIYRTMELFDRYEIAARKNLHTALGEIEEKLAKQPPVGSPKE